MKNQDVLLDLGLSKPEATIYLALLRSGGAKASAIARESGLKRTTIYAILKSLSAKGFVVMYFRKNAQLYYAERPTRVKHYFEKKISALTDILPSLEAFSKKELKISGVRFIESVEELKHFYENILLEYKKKSYFIIGNRLTWQGLDQNFFDQYRLHRAAAKIKTKLLLSHDSQSAIKLDDRALLREVKFLPKGHNFNSTIDIFDDKILIVGPELSALAVVIAISPMVDVFKVAFQLLWDLLPETPITPESPKPPTSPTPPRPRPPARSTTARTRTTRRSNG